MLLYQENKSVSRLFVCYCCCVRTRQIFCTYAHRTEQHGSDFAFLVPWIAGGWIKLLFMFWAKVTDDFACRKNKRRKPTQLLFFIVAFISSRRCIRFARAWAVPCFLVGVLLFSEPTITGTNPNRCHHQMFDFFATIDNNKKWLLCCRSMVDSDALLAVNVWYAPSFVFSRISSLSTSVPYLARARTIMINEAAKPTKLSNIVWCCKPCISPSACTEIERVVPRAVPRRHVTRRSTYLLPVYIAPHSRTDIFLHHLCLRVAELVLSRWKLSAHW